MKEKVQAPQLRFSGFTDDWEERKLGDITKISTGKLDANAMVENGKYDFYTSGIKKYRIDVAAFEGPSITIAGNGATVGYMHLADNKFNAYQRTYVLQEFLVDRSFIFSEIGNKLPKKIKQEARTGNIPYIVMDMLTELKLSIPQNNSEQQKIGSFFKQLDDTIALHQRKLDLLKEQKKGYLQKMFPKNGEKVPELRFAGFADDWEERKLSDGTNKIGDGLHGTPKYSEDGEVYFVNGNNLVNGQIVIMPETKRVTSNEQSKDDKALNESTILMSINGTIGNLAWYRGENLMLGKSAAYIEVSDFDKKFIYAYLQTRPVKDYYLNSLTGTTIKNLGLKAIRNTNICTPTIDEQAKIGSFFKKLDDTIALHQRKLDLLKEQKKGFLQKMFV